MLDSVYTFMKVVNFVKSAHHKILTSSIMYFFNDRQITPVKHIYSKENLGMMY